MISQELKEKIINLRKLGKTYTEINGLLNVHIPKSTLSYWCNDLALPLGYGRKVQEYNKYNLIKAREAALISKRIYREDNIKRIVQENSHLAGNLKNKDIAKIVLTVLYMTEGTRNGNGSITFGNSDPSIVGLFLNLLRFCYIIDESKFRCTLQCRADQNIKELESFWSNITGIFPDRFYKARIDPRTINKPTKKKNYKGVCRINYFSAKVYLELVNIAKLICMGR
ncbi:MAG: hypothetical protein Q7K35_02665 [bacterium]|nr:hypothetical protein [bacterium]